MYGRKSPEMVAINPTLPRQACCFSHPKMQSYFPPHGTQAGFSDLFYEYNITDMTFWDLGGYFIINLEALPDVLGMLTF